MQLLLDNHVIDKVKVVLDSKKYATKKESKYETGIKNELLLELLLDSHIIDKIKVVLDLINYTT